MRFRLLAALLLAAGCENLPEVLPPGFTTTKVNTAAVRLDFPTGIAVRYDLDASKQPIPGSPNTVLVASSNFSHAWNGGSVVSFQATYIDTLFAHTDGAGKKLACQTPIRFDGTSGLPIFEAGCDIASPQFTDAVMIGNYAGQLTLDDAGANAYVGSRDTSTLNVVTVDSSGMLGCYQGGGTYPDCRSGLINLAQLDSLDGPYAIVAGEAVIPGSKRFPQSQRVMYVASLVPFVNQIIDSFPITSSQIAALDQQNPGAILFSMTSSSQYVANGYGVGPMLFDAGRRQIVASGCYERFANSGAGELSSGKCFDAVTNYLRFLNVDSGNLAEPLLFDLHPDVQSIDTSDLLFADYVGNLPTTLWALMRTPDVLVKINLPIAASVAPRIEEIATMPGTPGTMALISRPGQSDLIAVTSEQMGAVAIYDTGTQQVVANVEYLGDTPSTIKMYKDTGTSAQLVVGVFGACSMALIEVPYDDPTQTAIRARIGGCEE